MGDEKLAEESETGKTYVEEMTDIKKGFQMALGSDEEESDEEEELLVKREKTKEEKKAEDEEFLRDYILNKRYIEDDNEDYVPTYDEVVHDSDEGLSEDEENVKKQEEFEVKFNF